MQPGNGLPACLPAETKFKTRKSRLHPSQARQRRNGVVKSALIQDRCLFLCHRTSNLSQKVCLRVLLTLRWNMLVCRTSLLWPAGLFASISCIF